MFVSRCINGVRVPAYVFCLVVVILIFAYGAFIRKTGRPDVLERDVTSNPAVQNLDGWAMTHFFFWAFMGFWYPGHHVQALGASLAWEGVEDYLGRTHITMGGSRLQVIGHTDEETLEFVGDTEGMTWYGRYTTDTAYNLFGYILGSALAKLVWPSDRCECKRCMPKRVKAAHKCQATGTCSVLK